MSPPCAWDEYAIEGSDADGVRKFSWLYHVAHVGDARRILEDRRISPELVRDESVLNDSRISVVWTSPNTWHDGSIYGNVSFTLPISVLDDRNFYWVEAMTYRPTALRILASYNQIDHPMVKRFDPEVQGSPLFRDKEGTWWRLNDFNYEVMFDEMFSLSEIKQIEFFDHHGGICNKHRRSRCAEAGRSKKEAAAMIAALALSKEDPDELSELLVDRAWDGDLVYAIARIGFWLTKRSYTHRAPKREDRAALFAAAMHHYAYGNGEHAKATLTGLENSSRAQKILLRRVKEVFGETIHMKVEHALDL